MAHQPTISDRHAWKRIANTALFLTGCLVTFVWLGNQFLSAWLLFIGLAGIGVSAQNFMFWKGEYVPWRDDPDPEPDPESTRKPFQYGPRDNGPANPPPWPQIVMALMGSATFLLGLIVGMGNGYLGGLYVQGPAAGACLVGLMLVVSFVGDGFDRAAAEENRRNND